MRGIPSNDNHGITADGLIGAVRHHEQRHPSKTLEILDDMLAHIDPVDFQQRAGVEAEIRVTRQQYIVIVIDIVLELFATTQYELYQENGQVYIFNGACWELLKTEKLRMFLGDAGQKMGVPYYKGKYHRFGEDLVNQFFSQAELPAPKSASPKTLINLQNGTFEISAELQQLRGFDSQDLLKYQLPFAYTPDAETPRFQQFLQQVLPEADKQQMLQEYLGYIFIPIGLLKLEKVLMLYGAGANGKSVVYEIVRALLGDVNVSSYSIKSLLDDKGYFRAMIGDKLLNYSSEAGREMNNTFFKQLASGEPVEARHPYGQAFQIMNYAKLMVNCNELPQNAEHTQAYFRRFLILPFMVTIPEKDRDPDLARKIIANELPGIFNWVLDGLKRVLHNKGFSPCASVEKQLQEFRIESDTVLLFLQEEGYEKSLDGSTPLKELYAEYKDFCHESGHRSVSKQKFSKRLKANGYTIERASYGMKVLVVKNSFMNPEDNVFKGITE